MKDMTPYQEMAASIGFGDSKLMPKMFAAIADEDEAKVILAASPPATLEELAEKTGFPVSKARKLVDDLFQKGLIYKSKKPDATRYYKFRKYIQFHDGTVEHELPADGLRCALQIVCRKLRIGNVAGGRKIDRCVEFAQRIVRFRQIKRRLFGFGGAAMVLLQRR